MPEAPPNAIIPGPALDAVVSLVTKNLSSVVEDAVAEGIRKGKLPEFFRTADAVAATGLSARSLKHLRASSQISYRKINGVILYLATELFEELNALRVPAKTNEATTAASTTAGAER